MASFLQVENISKSYGDKTLFRNISFNINEGDKIALIAPNGTGKSSLLKILAGLDSSDRGGEVRFMKDIKVAFLDQMIDFNPRNTLFDEVYSRLGKTYDVIRSYEQAIASGNAREIEQAMAAMDAADGWSAEQRIKQVLSSMKLTRLDQPMGELSGGEAKRAAIALMLLQEADFLIMDEPTNHLDIDVIEYLEAYLQKARCTLLMVTHDRYFLDRVCNTIFELDRGELFSYRGNYSEFLEKREERYTNMQANIDKARNLLRRDPDIFAEGKTGPLYNVYPRPEYTFGAFGAWAWGYSRVVDALERLKEEIPLLDLEWILFCGHSRGAKTAMLAGVLDERARIVNPNSTCAGGCGCYRIHMKGEYLEEPEKPSETLERLYARFPFWMGDGMADYTEREEDLPFDSHFLKALVAPRVLLDSEAAGDLWANPVGSWQTTMAAKEVWKFLGAEENLYWSFRPGFHKHLPRDVSNLVDLLFHLKDGAPLTEDFFRLPFDPPALAFDWKAPEKRRKPFVSF